MRTLAPFEEEGDCGLVANLASTCGTSGTPLEGLDLDDDARLRVHGLARLALNSLTAGMVANCPVTVRPCSPTYAAAASYWHWGGMTWISPLDSAAWLNACGCVYACRCQSRKVLDLNGPVAEVIEVVENGVVLAEDAYVLEANRRLRKVTGEWLTTQDMDKPLTEDETFGITYRPGFSLGVVGEGVLGQLVHEFAKAACGVKCKLPTGVSTLVRQGVTMQLNRGLFADGMTGIPEVDTYVRALNPHLIKRVPTIASADRVEHRVV